MDVVAVSKKVRTKARVVYLIFTRPISDVYCCPPPREAPFNDNKSSPGLNKRNFYGHNANNLREYATAKYVVILVAVALVDSLCP